MLLSWLLLGQASSPTTLPAAGTACEASEVAGMGRSCSTISLTHTHRIAFSLMESSHYSTQAPGMQKHHGCLFDRSLLPSPNGRQQKPINPLHDPPLLEPAPAAQGFYVSRAVHSPIAAWASGTSTPSPHLPLPPAK